MFNVYIGCQRFTSGPRRAANIGPILADVQRVDALSKTRHVLLGQYYKIMSKS